MKQSGFIIATWLKRCHGLHTIVLFGLDDNYLNIKEY